MGEITCRDAVRQDIPAVVSVHLASFQGFFLSSLGPRFLSLFYRGIVESEQGRLLVALDGRDIIGFVGGATEQAGFYRTLLRSHGISFAFAGAIAAIRHPRAIPRLLRARDRSHDDGVSPARACLMTLGVDPSRQSRGAGRTLVRAFQNSLAATGIDRYCLTTDAVDNDRTNSFYQSLGLTLNRVVVTPEGRRLNEYIGVNRQG